MPAGIACAIPGVRDSCPICEDAKWQSLRSFPALAEVWGITERVAHARQSLWVRCNRRLRLRFTRAARDDAQTRPRRPKARFTARARAHDRCSGFDANRRRLAR